MWFSRSWTIDLKQTSQNSIATWCTWLQLYSEMFIVIKERSFWDLLLKNEDWFFVNFHYRTTYFQSQFWQTANARSESTLWKGQLPLTKFELNFKGDNWVSCKYLIELFSNKLCLCWHFVFLVNKRIFSFINSSRKFSFNPNSKTFICVTALGTMKIL